MDRQNFLGRALGRLQYHRELSCLQLLHIQVLTLQTWPKRFEFPSLIGASQRNSQNRFMKWGGGWGVQAWNSVLVFHPRLLPQELLRVWRITLETDSTEQSLLVLGTRLLSAPC